MRGTSYAIGEIVWWMLASGAVGLAIGWLLNRVFGTSRRAAEAESKLEAHRERYAQLSQELGDWKTKSSKLKDDLEAKSSAVDAAESRVADLEGSLAGVRTELDAATKRSSALETSLTGVDEELQSARDRAAALEAKAGNVGDERRRIEELEQALANRTEELSDLRARHAGCAVAAEESSGRIAGLEARLAAAEHPAVSAPSDPAEQLDLEALAAAEETNDEPGLPSSE